MSFQRRMRRNAEKRAQAKMEHGKDGPKPGDVCVGCIHKPDPNGAHYIYVGTDKDEPNLEVTHPVTKKTMMAKWVLLCDTCLMEFGDDIDTNVAEAKIPLTCVKVWTKEDGKVVFLQS